MSAVKTTVLPTEDGAAYAERMVAVEATLQPRNATEALLAQHAVRASWMHDRANRVQTARLKANIEESERKDLEEIFGLGKRLFFDRRGPIYGLGRYEYIGERTSCSDVPINPDDPDTLVRQITRTVAGCQWMLDRWAELRALLEPGLAWNAQHKFHAIRLLGKQPIAAITDRDVAEIHLRTWTINPSRDTAWMDLRSELAREEYRCLRKTVSRQWPDLLASGDDQKERQVLIAIVERAVAEVKAKLAVAAERAERDAALRADCLSFDDTLAGERIRHYEARSHRKFVRSLSEFFKVRRATEDAGCEPQLEDEEGGLGSPADWSRRDHPPEAPPSQGGERDCGIAAGPPSPRKDEGGRMKDEEMPIPCSHAQRGNTRHLDALRPVGWEREKDADPTPSVEENVPTQSMGTRRRELRTPSDSSAPGPPAPPKDEGGRMKNSQSPIDPAATSGTRAPIDSDHMTCTTDLEMNTWLDDTRLQDDSTSGDGHLARHEPVIAAPGAPSGPDREDHDRNRDSLLDAAGAPNIQNEPAADDGPNVERAEQKSNGIAEQARDQEPPSAQAACPVSTEHRVPKTAQAELGLSEHRNVRREDRESKPFALLVPSVCPRAGPIVGGPS